MYNGLVFELVNRESGKIAVLVTIDEQRLNTLEQDILADTFFVKKSLKKDIEKQGIEGFEMNVLSKISSRDDVSLAKYLEISARYHKNMYKKENKKLY